ncbi:hypothetical protein REPUB_Repub02eG0090500 [Reevesia pubescens]
MAGAGLAEAYVMRSLHKEKMEKEKAATSDDKVFDDENKIPAGCFFWVSKKTNSAKVSSANYSGEKPV